jgi:uncharacterized protein YprB with RNaseH-like and TPR domain
MGITSACFDLECSSLNADFGVILCAVIKPADRKKPVVLRGDDYPSWRKGRSNDESITKAIAAELQNYDILVAHNGHKFDMPFLRSRMERWSLPPFPKKKLIDPVLLARNNLKLSWNSLEKVAEHLRIEMNKTPVTGETWIRAALDGDVEAMDYIAEHCLRDTLILERVLNRLKEYCSTFNHYGSGF